MFKNKNDLIEIKERLVYLIKEYFRKTRFSTAILGLSGGLDSTLTAYLAVEALGKNRVIGVMMPYKTSSNTSKEHAKLVIETLGIRDYFVEITPMIDSYFDDVIKDKANSVRRGNKMARERMNILFDLSARENALVLGTGNRSEILLGYSTWYGDSACSMDPIADLYKTEVFELSRIMNVPEIIINKKPSADLWENQTDEDELGITYEEADIILEKLIDEGWTYEKCLNSGIHADKLKLVMKRIQGTQYKRMLPVFGNIRLQANINNLHYPHDWSL